MTRILFFWLSLAWALPAPPPQEIALTIVRDPGISSDTVTLCRVRVVNYGDHAWPGRQIRFEAEALDGGTVVERARGRFGLSLEPHGSLETLIGFSGRYDRFSVRALTDAQERSDPKHGRRSGSGKRRKRKH